MSHPIAALATPPFPSAIAVLRISGWGLAEVLGSLVQLPPPRQAALRRLRWAGFDERALVLYFPSPHSYTGEDLVELQVHGNPVWPSACSSIWRVLACARRNTVNLPEGPS